jgi:hypothetical protein
VGSSPLVGSFGRHWPHAYFCRKLLFIARDLYRYLRIMSIARLSRSVSKKEKTKMHPLKPLLNLVNY